MNTHLHSYIYSIPMAQRQRFAARCGTSFHYLVKCALGFRKISESTAINVERESKGEIRVEQIRPDVDWAVIRGTKPKRGRAAQPKAAKKPARKTRA